MQRRKTQKRKVKKNIPRKQPNATPSLVKGIAGIANQFIPGSGALVRGASKLFGFGAYTTDEANRILASRVPTMNSTLDQGVRVSHHEYLGDVSSSVGFVATKYPLNPGVSITFPWLSSLAVSFQEYELNGLIFFFKATSANALNSTNTALGQIIGATQYNPYLPIPTTKIAMLGLSSAADGKPSESNIYPVECKADMVLFRSKLIRSGVPVDDLAKYDHGNFILASNGSQAAAIVGELHVVYDITLKKPKLDIGSAYPAWYYHAYSSDSIAATATPFAGTVVTGANSLGVTLNGATFTIPAASAIAGTKYSVRVAWRSANTENIEHPNVTFTNASAFNFYWGEQNTAYAPSVLTSNSFLVHEFNLQVTASNTDVTIAFAGGAIPTASQWDICISEMQ